MRLIICYMSMHTTLYTYTKCLSDISDRINICDITILNISYYNLYRRLFYSYIQLLSINLYIKYNVPASYI